MKNQPSVARKRRRSLITSHHISLSQTAGFVQGRKMGNQNEPDHSGGDGISMGSILVAAIPFCALVFGPFFANRLEPRIFGLPFLLAYCVFWVLMTPVFLFFADRLRKRR
jgi:hypothetical protein